MNYLQLIDMPVGFKELLKEMTDSTDSLCTSLYSHCRDEAIQEFHRNTQYMFQHWKTVSFDSNIQCMEAWVLQE